MNEAGDPEIVEAYYRTSTRAEAAVDNFHAGGMLFPLDIASGRLRPGCTSGFAADPRIFFYGQIDRHLLYRELRFWSKCIPLQFPLAIDCRLCRTL